MHPLFVVCCSCDCVLSMYIHPERKRKIECERESLQTMNDPEISYHGTSAGGGYQPLYHNTGMTQDNPNNHHHHRVGAGGQQPPPPTTTTTTTSGGTSHPQHQRQNLNFQRSNNIYWTLQLKNRQQPQTNTSTTTGATTAATPTTPKPNYQQNIEDLYSTPNKLTKTPRTPASGFSTFFRSQTGSSLNASPAANHNDDSITEPISPINPRNIMDTSDASLLTSTPTGSAMHPPSANDSALSRLACHSSPAATVKPKLSEELRNKLRLTSGEGGVRSHGNSPSNSGRSTPRSLVDQQNQQQQQPRGRHSWANDSVEIPRTCSDRMGTPKTSLMDFKKLLLSKSSGRSGKSTSAVEQLLLKKPTSGSSSPVPEENVPKPTYNRTANLSTIKIQDLSGSPKTFANRRILRAPGNFGSPGRGVMGGGGKSIAAPVAAIKAAAVKHDIMSTSIPEDHSAEEESLDRTPPPQSRGGLRHQSSDEMSGSPTSPPSPAPAFSCTDGIVSESVNLKENFFLKTEENNFPRNEILQRGVGQGVNGGGYGGPRSKYMHQQRQQFMGGNGNSLSYNNNSQFVQNRNLSKVGGTLSAIAENQPSPPAAAAGHNEAGTMPSGKAQPSLETSF